ncbi:MAG: radical SAM family heme chaperone HemW [Alphaproteobacteria bacterium]|uniref:Heme chaperone HemW n=1 Tax=Candidatus Nitrobium versatile TaxID=2884831 RepID=A0A953JEL5_9BACT|nr:radical SAM family heme chaperone HemW [Candidatus Nitrobium versatile]
MTESLYIHIPFCVRKCIYCDFYSLPLSVPDTGTYVEALCAEMALRRGAARNLRTVFIGGGTPTLLSATEAARLLDTAAALFSLRSDAEITIEANPGTITMKKASDLRAAGVNRMSIGVQSLIDEELSLLGRAHSARDALAAMEAVRKAGFENLSLDLMYGLPGQKMASWEYSLENSIGLTPEHFSTYELTPEEGTPLARLLEEGRLALPPEETVTDMYYRGIDLLAENGYMHYEISNFAKPGRSCAHNLTYWRREEYLGIGAAAHSFLHEKRTANFRDLRRYIDTVARGVLPVEEESGTSSIEAQKEMLFLGLRTSEGIDMERSPLREPLEKSKTVEECIRLGLLEREGPRLRLGRRGLVLSSEILVKILMEI